jgi:hypothetical protein
MKKYAKKVQKKRVASTADFLPIYSKRLHVLEKQVYVLAL